MKVTSSSKSNDEGGDCSGNSSSSPSPGPDTSKSAFNFGSRKGSRYRSRTIASMPTIGEQRTAQHITTEKEAVEQAARAATEEADASAADKDSDKGTTS
jgi:hypothetical protein